VSEFVSPTVRGRSFSNGRAVPAADRQASVHAARNEGLRQTLQFFRGSELQLRQKLGARSALTFAVQFPRVVAFAAFQIKPLFRAVSAGYRPSITVII
jgi:hypothetical protein